MVFSLEHDIKVTKSDQNLLPTQSVIVVHTSHGILILGNFTMAKRKNMVLLTVYLKIVLSECSQELKNAYQVDLLAANNITCTVYA
jgi:hypothetical protein